MGAKCCVFVDGENFRKTIVELFENEFNRNDYLPRRANWGDFYDFLCKKVHPDGVRLRTYWYVIDKIDFYPLKLYNPNTETEKLKKQLSEHVPFSSQLSALSGQGLVGEMQRIVSLLEKDKQKMRNRFDGWRRIQEGIATEHRSIEFRRAGAIWYNLFQKSLGDEKAVDVKLATDLIVSKDNYDYAIIVSGDQDFVPAVQHIKDAGKVVANISFRTRGGKYLPGGARRLNIETDYAVEIEYNDFKPFLNL